MEIQTLFNRYFYLKKKIFLRNSFLNYGRWVVEWAYLISNALTAHRL